MLMGDVQGGPRATSDSTRSASRRGPRSTKARGQRTLHLYLSSGRADRRAPARRHWTTPLANGLGHDPGLPRGTQTRRRTTHVLTLTRRFDHLIGAAANTRWTPSDCSSSGLRAGWPYGRQDDGDDGSSFVYWWVFPPTWSMDEAKAELERFGYETERRDCHHEYDCCAHSVPTGLVQATRRTQPRPASSSSKAGPATFSALAGPAWGLSAWAGPATLGRGADHGAAPSLRWRRGRHTAALCQVGVAVLGRADTVEARESRPASAVCAGYDGARNALRPATAEQARTFWLVLADMGDEAQQD